MAIGRIPEPKPAWVEGAVDRRAEHISVCYGEDQRAVALVAQSAKRTFTVQFLLKSRRTDARRESILAQVRQELTSYLHDIVGPDAWSFVQYHCTTPANRRSIVHWRWHPKPEPAARRTGSAKAVRAASVPLPVARRA